MYDYIKGVFIAKKVLPTGISVTIEAGGIGYLIKTTSRTIKEMPSKKSEIKMYISLIHKEDIMGLCGFIHKEERDLFEILQTVSGVGIKAALTLMDEFSVTELIGAVIKENYKEISRAKGIGQKSAQKIVLEIKDKLLARKEELITGDFSENIEDTECTLEAKNVLYSLGYSKEEIDESIKRVLSIQGIKIEAEEILKAALQYLAQK